MVAKIPHATLQPERIERVDPGFMFLSMRALAKVLTAFTSSFIGPEKSCGPEKCGVSPEKCCVPEFCTRCLSQFNITARA
jgi:hypothetical protein